MIERSAPLAVQVHRQLLAWIRDGSIGDARGALPAETEIARRLGVSRATVREALAWLERDRVIYRRHGSGTFINPSVRELPATLDTLLNPSSLIASQGLEPSCEQASLVPGTLHERAAWALGLSRGDPALVCSALFSAGGAPAIWLEAYIPWQPETKPPPMPEDPNILQFILSLTGEIATHSLARLVPERATKSLSQRLGLKPGHPLIRMDETHLTDEGSPVFFSQSHIAPGTIELQIIRKRELAPGYISVW